MTTQIEIKLISKDLSVSAQIEAADLQAIAAAGFKTIISNRPDDEQQGQPSFEQVSREATSKGLKALHIPVVPGDLHTESIDAFEAALADADKPIFAFCRTGTRSTMLWALVEAKRGTNVQAIIETAGHAGYDLSAMSAKLAQIQERVGNQTQ